MKIKKRRTEITVETTEVIAYRHAGHTANLLCGQCGGPLLTLDEARTAAGVGSRAIQRWLEAGQLHVHETPAGSLLVCLASLSALAVCPEASQRAAR